MEGGTETLNSTKNRVTTVSQMKKSDNSTEYSKEVRKFGSRVEETGGIYHPEVTVSESHK